MNRYNRLRPDKALGEAAHILSCTNPRQVWSLCALLSAAEAFAQTPEELLFFPALNHEKIRMLCEAGLDSKALDYKNGELGVSQIFDVLNHANRALTDYEGMRLIDGLRKSAGSDLALRVYMARLGNIQARYQDPRFHERVGRLIGMLEELPRTHRHKMSEKFWAMADPVLEVIRRFLEVSVLSLASGAYALLQLYDEPYREIIGRFHLQALAGASANNLLKLLLRNRDEWQSRFVIRVERTEERTAVVRFLELFARTTRYLRELRQRDPAYRRGGIARRLSPLERFPVVSLSDAEVVVPNVRYLYRNCADIIHFSLWEEKIKDYDQVRGGLQELYIQVLVETRLPGIIAIPERAYRRGRQSVMSADLILIEDDRLILLESKAQRIRAETRLNMFPSDFIDNLGGAVEAVKRSEAKIADLCAGLPEFKDVQAVVDRTRNRIPIIVAVVGEEVSMMGEVIRELEKSYSGFPLDETNGLYCILGIDAFERAVEVAAKSGKKLGELLEEYIREAKSSRPGTSLVDEFGGGVSLEDTFAASFFRE